MSNSRIKLAFVLSKNGLESLLDEARSLDTDGEDLFIRVNKILNSADLHLEDKESGSKIWYWNCIDWNISDRAIRLIDRFFFFADSISSKDYKYVCICEQTDEIEESGDYDDNPFGLKLVRDICINNQNMESIYETSS